tara:strand:- start:1204 stop:1839 length:636 start_codon:yes stop_codon:yes gene_type:complete
MFINNYFNTTIWSQQKIEFLKSLNKFSNSYIKSAKNISEVKKHIKKYGDFGKNYISTPLLQDNNFRDFKNYVGQKSWEYLNHQGYDMSQYEIMFNNLTVQEFSKKGGNNYLTHAAKNQHVSGFYFLKCSDKTPSLIFNDPRPSARITKLIMKDHNKIYNGSDLINFTFTPGNLIIFPSFLEHTFSVDYGLEPFRFIHWTVQAIPNLMNDDI